VTTRQKKLRLRNRMRANDLACAKGFNWRSNRVGEPARATLRTYQRFVGIAQSGEFDAATLDALFPARFRRRIAARATAETGVHEWPAGSNWGPVKKFIGPFIGNVPTAWCALFGAWSAWQAGFPKDGFWRDVAWVDSWGREGRDPANKRVRIVGKLRASRGDFALLDWNGDDDPDHLAIVTAKVGPLATLATVEGNVGAYGGSVEKRVRLTSQVVCFVRLHRFGRR